jgi:hypothetical protein
MEKKEKTPKNEEKKALIKKIVIWSLCIAVVLLALFSKQLFGSTLYGEDANGFIAIGDWFQAQRAQFPQDRFLVLVIWMILITLMKALRNL